MAVLPKSRVVDVTVTRQDNFPTITGFGTPLIVTDETPSGSVIDATTRTKTYASMEEVAADWDASDEAYKVANTMLSQSVRPTRIKIGYRDSDTGSDITDVQALQYPSWHGESVQINQYAIPVLDQEAVAADSARIDSVSGATITSQAYKESLQAAIDQRG